MDTTATFSNRSNAKRAAEKMIANGTAPAQEGPATTAKSAVLAAKRPGSCPISDKRACHLDRRRWRCPSSARAARGRGAAPRRNDA
jgi:hypothetical protein